MLQSAFHSTLSGGAVTGWEKSSQHVRDRIEAPCPARFVPGQSVFPHTPFATSVCRLPTAQRVILECLSSRAAEQSVATYSLAHSGWKAATHVGTAHWMGAVRFFTLHTRHFSLYLSAEMYLKPGTTPPHGDGRRINSSGGLLTHRWGTAASLGRQSAPLAPTLCT